ncbi:hypothetical protein BGZ61DRAFT_239999 [Ilyonectria robusta]|uniref:uncharacterized protein n=1 Tax=Ilyonectria robusta TaxID=1079257 RepID=UPI001E8E456A|nr:uncharacterized protein BGZ61DRAFT_239999 [Ilyonectria robusta]KAH8699932.1 hypothetical protein BGZ61DRAFT_239999 [Ilyonectria robusta]
MLIRTGFAAANNNNVTNAPSSLLAAVSCSRRPPSRVASRCQEQRRWPVAEPLKRTSTPCQPASIRCPALQRVVRHSWRTHPRGTSQGPGCVRLHQYILASPNSLEFSAVFNVKQSASAAALGPPTPNHSLSARICH